MTTNGKTFPVLALVFSRSCAKRSSSPATSPPRTTCFDIFSPPAGDSDVISHVDRLSSNETKIAPRSVRIAVGASDRLATVCMVASRVGGSNLTLSERRLLSTPHGILKAGEWFRRGRLLMVSPVHGEYRRCQAEIPLIVLCRFPRPPQSSTR